MLVDREKCVGCGQCVPYCPCIAIHMDEKKKAVIDLERCYECGICLLVGSCKFDALVYQEMSGPRLTRYYYNNVLVKNPVTGMTGRGTAEMKTNELTNKYAADEVGFGIELGRPDVGANFRDVQLITMALAGIGIKFDAGAPTTLEMEDPSLGTFPEAILDERIICSIVEFKAKTTMLPRIIDVLRKVEQKIDTVFSVDMVSRAQVDGSLPNVDIVKSLGVTVRPNAKTTVGLGRANV